MQSWLKKNRSLNQQEKLEIQKFRNTVSSMNRDFASKKRKEAKQLRKENIKK